MSPPPGPKKPSDASDLHKALAHPLRVDVLLRIQLDGKTSPNMLARTLSAKLNLIAYHVRVLLKYDAIELVDTRQRRGATEHFYAVKQNSDVVKALLSARLAEAGAASSKQFEARGSKQRVSTSDLARIIPLQLDRDGIKEVNQVLEELPKRLSVVEASSLDRLKASGKAPVLLSVGVVAFPWADEE